MECIGQFDNKIHKGDEIDIWVNPYNSSEFISLYDKKAYYIASIVLITISVLLLAGITIFIIL